MKVTVRQKSEVEVEIEFPLFFIYGGLKMAILNENESLYISSDSIVQSDSKILFQYYKDSEPITAKEFTLAFDARMEQIQQLKSQFFTK